MQNETAPKKVVASAVISELQSSDMYLTLKARLFDLRANLNGVRVTEAFLDEIVENEDKYICVPLYADIRGLVANRTIGHMYNARTGEFHSTQIGSFYHYEKEIDGDNTYLVGYARVMKRNKAICGAISNLFADNALKFSFEISCGAYEELENGDVLIDADPKNYWEGEAIVTFPACENAVALELVAECLGKGDENMTDDKIENVAEQLETEVNASAENVETENQETAVAKNTEVVEQAEVSAENQTETAETETASTIVVDTNHIEVDETNAYDCDSGESVHERVTVETHTVTPMEIAEDDAESKKDEDESEEEEDSKEDEDEKKKETASTNEPTLAEVLAEVRDLKKNFETIKAEFEASKNQVQETVVAETNDTSKIVNPFTAAISVSKKYSLLEKEEKSDHKRSLLDKA